MVNYDRKLDAPFHYKFLGKVRCTARIGKQQFLAEKAKAVTGFEPSLHRQNAVTLPLAPPTTANLKVVVCLNDFRRILPGCHLGGLIRAKRKSLQIT